MPSGPARSAAHGSSTRRIRAQALSRPDGGGPAGGRGDGVGTGQGGHHAVPLVRAMRSGDGRRGTPGPRPMIRGHRVRRQGPTSPRAVAAGLERPRSRPGSTALEIASGSPSPDEERAPDAALGDREDRVGDVRRVDEQLQSVAAHRLVDERADPLPEPLVQRGEPAGLIRPPDREDLELGEDERQLAIERGPCARSGRRSRRGPSAGRRRRRSPAPPRRRSRRGARRSRACSRSISASRTSSLSAKFE